MVRSLRNKTINGVGWSFADSILGQGVTFIVGLVLARLLSPDEYGLIGIITIFVTVLNSIVDSGLSNSLIRRNDVDELDYNTMFISNMFISIVVYFILFASAPLIAHFFGRDELLPLARVLGLVVIINALSITQYTILSKRLDFKTKTKASLISSLTSGVVGIGMAFMGFGVWSLVGQQLSRQFLYTLSLWFFNRWWPVFLFSMERLKNMWSFGWKILVSNIINTTWNELYQAVVGKCYTPATLGQYTRSRQFSKIFSANLTNVVQRVSFPALSEIQDDKERLKNAYRKVIRTTMFVTAICMLVLGAISEPLLYCLIGPQWGQAASFLPYICVSMSLYPLHAINLNMLQVQGRSDIYLKLEIIKKIIAIFPLLLGVFVSIYWMLIGSVIVGIISYFLNSHYSGKKLGYSSFAQLKDVLPSYTIALIMALSVYFIKYIHISYFVILFIQLSICAVEIMLFFKYSKLEEILEIRRIATDFLKKTKMRKCL